MTAPQATSRWLYTAITLKQGEIDAPLETECSRRVRTHVSLRIRETEKLGGRIILPPWEIPVGPKVAMFTNPVGNVTGLLPRVQSAVGRCYS